MVLGWAIYGTWNWKHDGYEILVHGDLNTRFFSHEIFWTRIARITRIFLAHGAFLREFFGTRISRISRILPSALWTWDFLNTNNTNNTNVILHTDLTDLGFLAFGSLWMTTRWVIDLLWLLTCCGYWLVVVIDSLWLLTCCGLNDKSKKISVSHAKHWQIREICEIRVLKNIRVIRLFVFKKTRVQKNLVFKMMGGSRWWVVHCGKWIHVIGVTHDRCDTWFW